MEQPKFSLGRTVATPGALAALQQAAASHSEFLWRHEHGDWGELSEDDKKENDFSVLNGLRILSAYTLSTGVRIWVLTQADRSSTTIMLPEEY
jgi:hypothetical protein